VLRDFWRTHRNPVWRFPSRQGGLRGAARATTPVDRGSIQITPRKVTAQCGIKMDAKASASISGWEPVAVSRRSACRIEHGIASARSLDLVLTFHVGRQALVTGL